MNSHSTNPTRRWLTTLAALALLTALLLSPSRVFARTGTDYDDFGGVARIASWRGDAFLRGNYQGDWGYVDENLVLEEGDEVLTGQTGRLTVELNDGVYFTLGPRSRALISRLSPGPTIRLRYGTFNVALVHNLSGYERVRVQWPDGALLLDQRGSYRVDVFRDGLARVAVLRGEGIIQASGGRRIVGAGEEVYVEPGGFPTRETSFRSGEYDDFDRYSYGFLNSNSLPLPRFLSGLNLVGLRDLMRFGDWRYVPQWGGYAWQPRRVSSDWRPYRDGRWVYTRLGWTWVPEEQWGYAPSHYGRWGYIPNQGWMWKPEKRYSPAWVRFTQVGDRIGWAPIDPQGRLAAYPRGRLWYERSPFIFTHIDTMKSGRRVKIDPPKVKPEKVVIVDKADKLVAPTNAAKVKAVKLKQGSPDSAAASAHKAEQIALKTQAREEVQARKQAESRSLQADKVEQRRLKAAQDQAGAGAEKPPRAAPEPKPAREPKPDKAQVPDEPKPDRGPRTEKGPKNDASQEGGFVAEQKGETAPKRAGRQQALKEEQRVRRVERMKDDGPAPAHDEAGDFHEQGRIKKNVPKPVVQEPAPDPAPKAVKQRGGKKNAPAEEYAAPAVGNGGEAPPADAPPADEGRGHGGGRGQN